VRRAKPMDVTGLYVFGDDGKSYNATETIDEEGIYSDDEEDEEEEEEEEEEEAVAVTAAKVPEQKVPE